MVKIKQTNDFIKEIMSHPGGENILKCVACGTCSAGCPVHQQNENFNPRKIIRMIKLRMREEVLKSDYIWLCSVCYNCYERCPQDVKCTEIMRILRNIAAKEGYAPQGVKLQLEAIEKFGRIYEIEEFDNKKREKMGLAKLETKVDLSKLIKK